MERFSIMINSFFHTLTVNMAIYEINADGLFGIVWGNNRAIRPIPFPSYRFTELWHENWAAPPSTGVTK